MKKLNIIIIGLKTFGQAIAKQLYEYNCDVLAIDKDLDRVEDIAEYVSEAIQMDIRDVSELKKISLDTFDIGIITLDDIGSSIMATMIFEEAGIERIIVKSTSDLHKKILEKMGVKDIVSPDKHMGIKLAKSIMNVDIIEKIDASSDYNIEEVSVKKDWIGKRLEELDLREDYGMNVIGVRKANSVIKISPERQYEIEKGDKLVVIENKNASNSEDMD